jgi:uncharacterized phage protein gp47/JayE
MTLSATVSAAGISAPSYATVLDGLRTAFRAIYGSDVYIAPDSQDGQFLALIAAAINDTNQSLVDVYNSFSPTYAQGSALSRQVKINGIARLIPTYSTAVGLIVGQVGATITGGVVQDTNGNKWNVPTLTIPPAGQQSITVTAQLPGAIAAPAGSIVKIVTPQLGWQSFTSTADAALGSPVESDAALRKRQIVSTSLPAQSPVGALLGALLNTAGVTRAQVYENPTGTVDANGLPAYSISAVVAGGNVVDVAKTIGQKKTPGAATYGTTSQVYTDPATGIPYTIKFYALAQTVITTVVNIKAMAGYSSTSVALIQAAIAAYLSSLPIGAPVQFTRLYAPAYAGGSTTYEVLSMTVSGGTSDVVIPFNSSAYATAANVTVNVS